MAENSFIAPEGTYTYLEEHRPLHVTVSPLNAAQYPTRISTVVIRFPAAKAVPPAQGITSLLVGGKDGRTKDKERINEREKETFKDGRDSLSSSDAQDERETAPDTLQDTTNPSVTDAQSSGVQYTTPTLFSPAMPSGKRKSISRRKVPKHSIKSTNSSFVTRQQSVENLSKVLSNLTGEVTFLFYNASKSFIWTQVSTKLKVRLHSPSSSHSQETSIGTTG